ncbi:Ubiquitin carboxyl-terminal hydrolase [Hondaea fermentalgiana]|uniref:Ubiquitin carboxyl-terminal hydrolase n=1 Tax=Hondaea fermentalgiana TaxID=2315210 RepID=A0A2R5GVE0_9STRA|nr:Ubiquitin carboxyl-terminal hydrolase [Hondaea fermentalgiana]|eukprot:GBG34822.1 Ubiquitin carboxyl-terminal hydrolase [Hondaea fermentalgiana]
MSEKATKKSKTPRWLPLESNPDVLNSFLRRMEVDESVAFHDVFGLDEELLAMIPQPVVAMCLLFPSSTINAIRREQFADKCIANPAEQGIFYLHQLSQFGNACGTIACVHATANAAGVVFDEASPLGAFIEANRGKDPDTIGENLADAVEIHEASEQSASSSGAQTATPSRDDSVEGHFITFVLFEGHLLELDGMMPGPIDHGEASESDFTVKTAEIIKTQFMDLDPGNVNFNITAMSIQ